MTKLYINTAHDWLIINAAGDWLIIDDEAPADYPTTPMWARATITSFAPSFVSVTHGLGRQARSRGGHAWQISLYYSTLTRDQFAALWAFLNKQGGQAGIFTWQPSTPFATRGTGNGSPFVSGAGQTGTTLTTDGWANSETVAKAGDWFTIGGDTKVYQLTADVVSNGSGDATMEFYPSLRLTPVDQSPIDLSVVFRVSLASDLVPVDWSQCVHVQGFSVDLVEVP
jgi:hypothetical protein